MATRKKTTRRAAPRKTRPRQPQRRQPESLLLRSLGVWLTVGVLGRGVAWYRDMLGFTPGGRWEEDGQLRGVQMRAGSCDIMLGQGDLAKGRDRRKGEGFRVWVETAQGIDAIAARLKAKGWPLDREPSDTPWGDWAFALTDPDGFKLTFIQAE